MAPDSLDYYGGDDFSFLDAVEDECGVCQGDGLEYVGGAGTRECVACGGSGKQR